MSKSADNALLNADKDLVSPTERQLSFEREPGVTDIHVEVGVVLVVVRFDQDNPLNRLSVLQKLAEARVPVNQVKLQPEGLSFVVGENYANACRSLLKEKNSSVTLLENMALISTIAGAMRDLSGVIAQICEALLTVGILHRQTGDAYDSVLFLVPTADAPRAVTALRQQFGLDGQAR